MGIFLHAPRLSSGLSLTIETQITGKNKPAYSYTFPTVLTGALAYRVVYDNNLTITPNFLAKGYFEQQVFIKFSPSSGEIRKTLVRVTQIRF